MLGVPGMNARKQHGVFRSVDAVRKVLHVDRLGFRSLLLRARLGGARRKVTGQGARRGVVALRNVRIQGERLALAIESAQSSPLEDFRVFLVRLLVAFQLLPVLKVACGYVGIIDHQRIVGLSAQAGRGPVRRAGENGLRFVVPVDINQKFVVHDVLAGRQAIERYVGRSGETIPCVLVLV
jgi:hypothetical protein